MRQSKTFSVEVLAVVYSPGELAKKGVFVGKKYGKAETSQKVSYGYVEPPKKSPHESPLGITRYGPFYNGHTPEKLAKN